ncbi:La ribonucleoprotein [Stylosanthes scabra]|uniref:La ribonucleoprotein n=1 Tax=Stylosanthes scabra TaxID=79078 RepID=A0ABU6Y5F1_9FABA|nr:La ribonucleoprotein [Stylosanthes scabra]
MSQENNQNQNQSNKKLPGFFEVDDILRKRIRRGEPEYLIKWAGGEKSANSWEPLENLELMLDYVHEFDASLKSGVSGNMKKKKNESPRPRPFIANMCPRPHFLDSDDDEDEGEAANNGDRRRPIASMKSRIAENLKKKYKLHAHSSSRAPSSRSLFATLCPRPLDDDDEKEEEAAAAEANNNEKDDTNNNAVNVNVTSAADSDRSKPETTKNVKNKRDTPSKEEDSEKEDPTVNIVTDPLPTPNPRRLLARRGTKKPPCYYEGSDDHHDSDADSEEYNSENDPFARPHIVLFADPI